MTAATHIWAPFRDTSLFVEFLGSVESGESGDSAEGELLAGAVPSEAVTRDDRYGEPLWRVDAEHLHAVVEALWSTDHPLHIHLDQAPIATDDVDGP
ncbi:hypothetical protein ABZ464_21030 [Streptomyces sp. NPDC005820]|uniref:hypothetical protein n=1 Tax=Streptomyces sp. NPDC005820 TaxID=3157069 RepID=UPI0033F355FC